MALTELEMETQSEQRARLTSAERAALPDSAFAYIDPQGGRHFPIHDAAHVRNALARIAQGAKFGAEALPKVRAAARKFGIHSDDSHGASRSPEQEQRRRRWANSLLGQASRHSMPMTRGNVEMRAKPDGTGGTNFEFRGYASTFLESFPMWDKYGDPYDEDVWPGSFTETLSRKDLDTPFLIGHNEAGIPMARTRSGTMRLTEDTHGLDTFALLSGRRSDVRDLADAVERGDIDEMSIGFITRGQKWSDDYAQRHLTKLDLHRGDVSVVALAANPGTRGATMSSTFPTEILSRQAAEQRAAAAPTTDDPDSDHMEPMVGANHGEWTGTHTHPHEAFGRPDADENGQHGHEHTHNADNIHGHVHGEADTGAHSSGEPHEHRGNPIEVSMGDAPDYNPDAAAKRCAKESCPGANSPATQPAGASFCSYCGDALVRIDDQGVPGMEEESGEQAALALRRRRLEYLKVARR